MMSASRLFVLLLLGSALIPSSAQKTPDSYQLSHLLKPQLRFEFNLIIPYFTNVTAHPLPPSLLRSMEYLEENQTPFRFYNYNSSHRIQPPPMIRTFRHLENQVAHLVFVMPQYHGEALDLQKVWISFMFRKGLASSAINKDLNQVIVDGTALTDPWNITSRGIVPPKYLPLYFLMFFWSGGEFRFPRPLLVRETCECDDIPSVVLLDTDLTTISEPKGMKVLRNEIRAVKTNFQGRNIIICPTKKIYARWVEWKSLQVMYSFRTARKHPHLAFAGLLLLFNTAHNFTFDTVDCPIDGFPEEYMKGVIRMEGVVRCYDRSNDNDCYVPPLRLFEYHYYCTLSFSQPSGMIPVVFSSLAIPVNHEPFAGLLLVGTSIALTLLLVGLSGKWNVFEVSLSVFAGLIGKSWIAHQGRRYELCYLCWLLLVGFISWGYTNVLQSIIVVPRIHHIQHTIDDMLRENLTFKTVNYAFAFIKSRTRLITEGEKRLVERIVEVKDFQHPSTVPMFVKHFSEGERNVLVILNLEQNMKWLPSLLKLDLIVGTERFFNYPYWWDVTNVERGSLLAESVEFFMEVGLHSYFLKLFDSFSWNDIPKHWEHYFFATNDSSDCQETTDGCSKVTLKDSLVNDSFVLWLCGMSFAVIGFVWEMLAAVRLSRWILALRVKMLTYFLQKLVSWLDYSRSR